MSKKPPTEGVPVYKGYVPFYGPFAFRRFFLYVIVPLVVLTVFVLVREYATPTPPREKLKARELSALMARAMRGVHSAALTGGTITLRVDQTGTYEATDTSNGTVNEVVIGPSVFFRADATALNYWLTNGTAPLSSSRAEAFATHYANRWFTTGRVASGAHNPPAEPSTAGEIFHYLGLGRPAKAQLGSPVTDDGRLTIPLMMNGTTWFIPASGNASPLTATFYTASTYAPLDGQYGFTIAYGTGAITLPKAVTAPIALSHSWNTSFHDPTTDRITYFGLLYFASH